LCLLLLLAYSVAAESLEVAAPLVISVSISFSLPLLDILISGFGCLLICS
jgi:hypothetical protein